MKILSLLIGSAAFGLATTSMALVATDNAANYASWTNGSNGGSGFLGWVFDENNNGSTVFAGGFLGDSTAGAGNINSPATSFGLFANPGAAFINADRAFASSLVSGDSFTFDLALNFDNGNKGMVLFAGAQGEVFNFNVGTGASVSSANATITPATGTYDYGGNDAVFNFTFTMTTGLSFDYEISRTSSLNTQGVLFSGSVTGLTEGLSGFRFYNSGTDNGDAQNNLYFNNLNVIPEPNAAALVGLGLLTAFRRFRPRR